MSQMFHGTVHGRTIELAEELGLADGEEIEVSVTVIARKRLWGEGLRRCAGALAEEWTEDDDRILEELSQERKLDTRKEVEG